MTRPRHPDDIAALCGSNSDTDFKCRVKPDGTCDCPSYSGVWNALTAVAEAQERRGAGQSSNMSPFIPIRTGDGMPRPPSHVGKSAHQCGVEKGYAEGHRAGWEQGIADAAKKMRLMLGIIEDMGATEDRLVLQQRVAMATCINETLLAVEAITYSTPTPATESETKE